MATQNHHGLGRQNISGSHCFLGLLWLWPVADSSLSFFLTGLPVSQHSEEQPSHDKQPATKLALYPRPPAPPVSLFLSYFLLLPFSYSPLQLSHPPSKGLEGVSGSQRLLFPSSLLFLLSRSAPLSDLCEGWKQLSAVVLMDWVMTERQTAVNDYTRALCRIRSSPRV